MTTPRVTVLMSVYNGARHLAAAIESILAQTFDDFEFLIVDDGSTDRSRELIASYHDPRIRLLVNGINLGLTRSLNGGLESAQGELLARQDADDISEPDRLAKQVAFLDAHPDVGLVGAWYKKIDESGREIGERPMPCDHLQICWCFLFFCPFTHSAAVWRRARVRDEIGAYNEAFRYAQDWELWVRIARRMTVANVGEFLVKYRVNPSSMTATCGSTVQAEIDRILTATRRAVLGDGEPLPFSADDFREMRSLLFHPRADCSAVEARRATRSIRRLHDAFCQFQRTDPPTRREHRARVLRDVSHHLIGLAQRSAEANDHADARSFFAQACRLRPSCIWEHGSRRLLGKLLLGPRLVAAIGARGAPR